MEPTKATQVAARVAVSVLVAVVAAKAGKGLKGAALAALIAAVAHEVLDAPVAKLMANAWPAVLGEQEGAEAGSPAGQA
jgi:hypothetical protein